MIYSQMSLIAKWVDASEGGSDLLLQTDDTCPFLLQKAGVLGLWIWSVFHAGLFLQCIVR